MTNILGNTKKKMKKYVNINQTNYAADQQNTPFSAFFWFGDNYSLSCTL